MSVIIIHNKDKSIQMPWGISFSPSYMLENLATGRPQPRALSLKLHSYAADTIGAKIIAAYPLPAMAKIMIDAGFKSEEDNREKVLELERKIFSDNLTEHFSTRYYTLHYLEINQEFRSYWQK